MRYGGEWKAMPSLLSIDEDNRALTSQQLAMSLLSQAQGQARSPFLKKWLFFGDPKDWEINWSLGHDSLCKMLPGYIAPWTGPRLLSEAIEAGCYD